MVEMHPFPKRSIVIATDGRAATEALELVITFSKLLGHCSGKENSLGISLKVTLPLKFYSLSAVGV